MRTSNKNMKFFLFVNFLKKKSPTNWQGIFQFIYALKSTIEYIAKAHTASKQNGININSDLLQAKESPQTVMVSITAYSFILNNVL